MVLNDVKLMGRPGVFNIGIDGARISFISDTPFAEFDDRVQLYLEHAQAFPGLINSHDHLNFDLFPQLGYQTYNNYVEWGDHIHQSHKQEIQRVLNVPAAIRAKWGMYKNLICGVTTVVDHGPKHNVDEPLISIYYRCQNLHSVRRESSWRSQLNNPMKIYTPAVIHVGEGIDKASANEIDELIRWNILQRDLVGVHGVAMTAEQARHFRALVWCPATNYFLLNRTAPVDILRSATTILFGTDSTLTAHWDIWDHIRLARKTGLLSEEELYRALTTNAAATWELNSGTIAEGRDADIMIVKPGVSFFDVKPQDILLVIQRGKVRLLDEGLNKQLAMTDRDAFVRIEVNGTYKLVQGDINKLMGQIRDHYPEVTFPISAEQAHVVH